MHRAFICAACVLLSCQGTPGPQGPQGQEGPVGRLPAVGPGLVGDGTDGSPVAADLSVLATKAESGRLLEGEGPIASSVQVGVEQTDPTASGGRIRFGAASAGATGTLWRVERAQTGGLLSPGRALVSARLKVTNNQSGSTLAQLRCAAVRRGETTFQEVGTAIPIRPSDFAGNGQWQELEILCGFLPDDVDQAIAVEDFVSSLTDHSVDVVRVAPVTLLQERALGLRAEAFHAYLTNAEDFTTPTGTTPVVRKYPNVAQNSDPTVFRVEPDGTLRILRPGVITAVASFDVIVTSSGNYAYIEGYINDIRVGAALAHSAGSTYWSQCTLNLSWKVAANDVLRFVAPPSAVEKMDNAPWSHLSVTWMGR